MHVIKQFHPQVQSQEKGKQANTLKICTCSSSYVENRQKVENHILNLMTKQNVAFNSGEYFVIRIINTCYSITRKHQVKCSPTPQSKAQGIWAIKLWRKECWLLLRLQSYRERLALMSNQFWRYTMEYIVKNSLRKARC